MDLSAPLHQLHGEAEHLSASFQTDKQASLRTPCKNTTTHT